MANTGGIEAGYKVIGGKIEKAVRSILPNDVVRYKILNDGADRFALNLYVLEYWYDGFGYEQSSWVYLPYTSPYTRNYYTVSVDIVHNVARARHTKRYVDIATSGIDNRFYDPSLDEKLGGEVMTLGR
jgi:hypothetical protein